jgi:alcohol dehydrogenase, propanol-preferring
MLWCRPAGATGSAVIARSAIRTSAPMYAGQASGRSAGSRNSSPCIGGLGGYAVQYAKILGSGATVVAFARNLEKLVIAKDYGADHIIAVKGKSSADISKELSKATGRSDVDAVIDCAGATEMMQLAFNLLSISGHYADVGLVGDRMDIPLFPRVHREQTFYGSFWGNNTDLSEVMVLAAEGKIRHTLKMFTFNQINEYIDLLRKGEIVGRAVMKF